MLQFYIQYGVHITNSIGNKHESKGSFLGKPPKDIIVKRKKRRLDRVFRPRTRCHRQRILLPVPMKLSSSTSVRNLAIEMSRYQGSMSL